MNIIDRIDKYLPEQSDDKLKGYMKKKKKKSDFSISARLNRGDGKKKQGIVVTIKK